MPEAGAAVDGNVAADNAEVAPVPMVCFLRRGLIWAVSSLYELAIKLMASSNIIFDY